MRISTKNLFSLFAVYAVIIFANQIAASQYVCQLQPSPIVQSGSIGAGDPTQNARINRDGTPSSCTGGAPTAAPIAGTFRYDAYTYTNPHAVEACVVVEYNMTACGTASTQVNAYSTFSATAPNTNVIGEPGFSTVGTGTLTFRVAASASFTIVVHEVAANAGCPNYNFTLTYRTGCRQAGYDRTNDGKADPTLFTPSSGTWSIFNSAGGTESKVFGLAGDIITPGDYTGDGQTDVSTYRPSSNTWFYATDQASPQTNVTYVPWGASGDIPVPGDYDKDGKTDVAVWRPSNGTWYTLRSSNNTLFSRVWGQSGDTPVVGDYDGDLTTDFVVARPSAGQYRWLMLNSNFGYGFVYGCGTATPSCGAGVTWGVTTDRLVSGDFDGDARSDIAVYRPSTGTWMYRRSSLGLGNAPGATSGAGFAWGIAEDIPQPADYDGDKWTDFAVFRPSTGTWYISNSVMGTWPTATFVPWGAATDQPATSAYRVSNP